MTSPSAPRCERRLVYIRPQEDEVVDELVEALEDATDLYQRSQSLVRVLRDGGERKRGVLRPPEAPTIRQLPLAQLRREVCKVVEFRKGVKAELAHPPQWAIDQLSTLGHWPTVPNLEAIVESPVLRPDGTVIQRPGYDEDTGVFFAPPDGTHYRAVPDRPTAADVRNALSEILDVIVDFQFVSSAHQSAWLAGVLSYFSRFAHNGVVPLNLIDANVQRAGKGLLCEVAGWICLGREMAVSPYRSGEDEVAKALLSIAQDGDPLVLIDNISGPFGCASLDAFLTSRIFTDRLLSTNVRPKYVVKSVLWANGNNVQFRKYADTAARTNYCRIESPEENPEQRKDFRYPDLIEVVKARRADLAVAVVTLLRAYHCAGRPRQGLPNWGRFESWSAIVREPIVWLGLHDPFQTNRELKGQADTTSRLLEDLVTGWREYLDYYKLTQVTVREVKNDLESEAEYSRSGSRRFPRLFGALSELCPTKNNRLDEPHAIGNALRRFKGRNVGGYCLKTVEPRTTHGQPWTVVEVGKE